MIGFMCFVGFVSAFLAIVSYGKISSLVVRSILGVFAGGVTAILVDWFIRDFYPVGLFISVAGIVILGYTAVSNFTDMPSISEIIEGIKGKFKNPYDSRR